ncbi:MAG: carotenoid biosynthesis protein [Candidatus Thermoplasmatota archaeon]|nr:carotenoid biosynthesis protein [Candidatus Thermoplasmatota archaeon]
MIYLEVNQHAGEQTEFLLLFIATIAIVWFLLVAYSYKKYGPKKTIMYFLPMIIAALFIESAGVASGRYYYPGYFLYLSVVGGGVPLVIVLAWSANLFLFFNMAKHVVMPLYQKCNYVQLLLISFVAGSFAVCLDLLEDPLAHHNNWWIWEETVGGIKFYEVPLLNFVGWFVLIFFMTFATALLERSRFSENRKVLLSISSISITGVIIFIVHGLLSNLLQSIGLA